MSKQATSLALPRRREDFVDRNVDERAAADYLGLSVATLRRWRLLSRGPRYRKLGSLVRYSVADLRRWLDDQPCGGETQGRTSAA